MSVIAHAPATAAGHPAATAPNAYSISGILGIPAHHQDPNGNSIKRKRTDDGESLNSSLLANSAREIEFERFKKFVTIIEGNFKDRVFFFFSRIENLVW